MPASYAPHGSNSNSSRVSTSTPKGGPGTRGLPQPAVSSVSTPARPVLV